MKSLDWRTLATRVALIVAAAAAPTAFPLSQMGIGSLHQIALELIFPGRCFLPRASYSFESAVNTKLPASWFAAGQQAPWPRWRLRQSAIRASTLDLCPATCLN